MPTNFAHIPFQTAFYPLKSTHSLAFVLLTPSPDRLKEAILKTLYLIYFLFTFVIRTSRLENVTPIDERTQLHVPIAQIQRGN